MAAQLWMVYTCILIHSARMKTKGKEFVKIIDIWDSSAELTKKKL